jgi:hypothetical protein
MTQKRSWSELGPASRAAIIAAGVVQFGLLGAALADLRRRRDDEINGPRRVWIAVSFINFVGPIAYFVFGRRR